MWSTITPLLMPCGRTSIYPLPFWMLTGYSASTDCRWSLSSFACIEPNSGSTSSNFHTSALPLFWMSEPLVRSVKASRIASAVSFHERSEFSTSCCQRPGARRRTPGKFPALKT